MAVRAPGAPRVGGVRAAASSAIVAAALIALAGGARAERRGARGGSGGALAPPSASLEVPCLTTGADGACTRWALDGFYQSLTATEDGGATRPARISFVGDS